MLVVVAVVVTLVTARKRNLSPGLSPVGVESVIVPAEATPATSSRAATALVKIEKK